MKLPEPQSNMQGCDFEAHTLDLPQCCPVSHNPLPGSTVTICYRPGAYVLDIVTLYTYIHQYVGGLQDENGEIIVRDLEVMIARIAEDCAQVVQVPVSACARLLLTPKQSLYAFVRKKPESKGCLSQ